VPGLLLFASVLVTYAAIRHRGRAVALADPRAVARFAQVLLLAAVIGAHVGGLVIEHGLGVIDRPSLLLSAGGSFSSAGGAAAAAIAGAIYLRIERYDVRAWADVVAWAFPFGWLVARAGCALAHDHPGRLSSSWAAVRFPGGARLDCGLLEWMAAPIVIALVVTLGRRRLPAGRLAGLIGTGYVLIRFPLDLLRAADLPGSDPRWHGLTIAQWFCLALFAACVPLVAARPPRVRFT
jgi:phosphatidylglycerol---prolipoprotein diacylglyceryl transferase